MEDRARNRPRRLEDYHAPGSASTRVRRVGRVLRRNAGRSSRSVLLLDDRESCERQALADCDACLIAWQVADRASPRSVWLQIVQNATIDIVSVHARAVASDKVQYPARKQPIPGAETIL